MSHDEVAKHEDRSALGRRELLAYTAAFGTAFLATQGLVRSAEGAEDEPKPAKAVPGKRYDMKKSINLWAFPYPQKMSLKECFQLAKDAGFDGVEINFALEGEFSAESQPTEIDAIGDAGPEDRHRHQRRLLVPLLALLADAQRSARREQGHGAGPADDRRGPPRGHREPARAFPARSTSPG